MDETRLAAIPLFAGLSKGDRRQVAQFADEVDVAAGRQLIEEGEFGYEFFAIEDGTASVSREGTHIRDLGPGDFFGEIALVETERRTATVVAASPMRVVVMTRRDFQRMAYEFPEVTARISQAIRERLGS